MEPQKLHKHQLFSLLFIAILGTGLSVYLYFLNEGWEKKHIQSVFTRVAENRIQSFHKIVDESFLIIESLSALYDSSQEVTRKEFSTFVKPILKYYPSIQALEWVPRISHSQRTTYEKKARQDGFIDFEIKEKSHVNNLMEKAAKRNEYFPVYFIEPLKGNEAAFGFDLASNLTRYEALKQARDTAELTATSRIILVQEKDNHFGFLLFKPQYAKKNPVKNLVERRKHLTGFVIGVFRIGPLFHAALQPLEATGVNVSIFDRSAPESEQVLYGHISQTLSTISPTEQSENVNSTYPGISISKKFQVANRTWEIVSSPTANFIKSRETRQPIIVLILGLIFTWGLCSIILLFIKKAIKAQQHAEQSLTAKQNLEKEIKERKQIEEEKARLETQLRQSQKMEAIGTLAGGIAHDFNNILTAIIGYTEIAKASLPIGDPADKDLDEVLKASSRARDLVKQILAFSRKTEQERKPVEPHLIVKEALQLMRASIPTTIDLQQNIDPNSGTIMADPTQLHQIVVNLCTNAFHAMEEEGGVLKIELVAVDLGANDVVDLHNLEPGPYTRLSVTDTGPGIDMGVQERIFDPYFTTKEFGKGSGMGLSVVHGIIKGYGGAVTVESKIGEGSTFNVYFPRVEVTVEQKIEVVDSLLTGTERILVVDDESVIVEMYGVVLEGLGYDVSAFTSSIEALDTFKTRPDDFDLIITDQSMPLIPGSELARKLMKIRPNIPIILCTGYSSTISEETAKEMGIREFVLKPVDRKELARLVRKVLDE